MDMTVKLQVFEGPLDLLLHLLDKNKVNIYDIPIVEITKQYMDYIREMKRLTSECGQRVFGYGSIFHTFRYQSPKMLLPAPPEEEEEQEDPRAELVQQLRVQDVQMYLL